MGINQTLSHLSCLKIYQVPIEPVSQTSLLLCCHRNSSLPEGVREFQQKFGTAKGKKPEGLLSGQRAYEQGSLRGMILAKGGIRSDSEALANLEPEEIKALRRSGIIMDKDRYPDTPGADEVFGDLKEERPDFMAHLNEESDMLRAIADKSYKNWYNLSEAQILKQEQDYYENKIAQQAESENLSPEALARVEEDVKREIAAEREGGELGQGERPYWDVYEEPEPGEPAGAGPERAGEPETGEPSLADLSFEELEDRYGPQARPKKYRITEGPLPETKAELDQVLADAKKKSPGESVSFRKVTPEERDYLLSKGGSFTTD